MEGEKSTSLWDNDNPRWKRTAESVLRLAQAPDTPEIAAAVEFNRTPRLVGPDDDIYWAAGYPPGEDGLGIATVLLEAPTGEAL